MEIINFHNPHVLVVEDDPAVLHLLQATIEYGGFTSEQASSAAEALMRLDRSSFDSILLDLGLPDTEGGRLIREIRSRSDVPIVVVSGNAAERMKIEALDAGADDFVEKPFLPGELLARIRAALRRGPGEHTQRARSERSPRHASGKSGRGGASDSVSMQEKLIRFMHSRKGGLVTGDEIIEAVWGKSADRTEKNVRVLVATARRHLRMRREPLEIVNEHGRGYRLRGMGGSSVAS